jgi:hypothetical protein
VPGRSGTDFRFRLLRVHLAALEFALRQQNGEEPEFMARWRRSQPDPCCLCGKPTDCGILLDEEIRAGWGSRYDTQRLVWLGDGRRPEREPEGQVCDACIDQLVAAGRVAVYFSDAHGPAESLSDEAVGAVFRLGIRRMERIITGDAAASGQNAFESAYGRLLHLVGGERGTGRRPRPEAAGMLFCLAARAANGHPPDEQEIARGIALFSRRAERKSERVAAVQDLLEDARQSERGEIDQA